MFLIAWNAIFDFVVYTAYSIAVLKTKVKAMTIAGIDAN